MVKYMRNVLGLVLPLAFGVATTDAAAQVVVAGLKAAENLIQTTNGRIFASGDGALLELKQENGTWRSTTLPARFADGKSATCYFLGISEIQGMVYSLCAENLLNPLAKKHLFAFDSRTAMPQAKQVGELSGVDFPNGLSSDGNGALFAANSGLPLLAGKIHKISLNNPGSTQVTIRSQSVLHQFAACKPNGVHYANGRLYVSVNPFSYLGLSQLLRYDVSQNELSNKNSLYSSWNFLDDFALVQGGVLAAEFLGGKISHISETGTFLQSAAFAQPTSALVLKNNAGMLVTERGNGRVLWMANTWGLQAR